MDSSSLDPPWDRKRNALPINQCSSLSANQKYLLRIVPGFRLIARIVFSAYRILISKIGSGRIDYFGSDFLI